MAKRSRRQRWMRATAALLVGGSALQLGSCDATVRSTLLTGLETTTSTLAQTFISAFFGNVTPGRFGDLWKITFAHSTAYSRSQFLISFLYDRILDGCTMAILALIGVFAIGGRLTSGARSTANSMRPV